MWRQTREGIDVPLQAAVREATLGVGHGEPTRRSGGEMRDAQSDDAPGHARDGARRMIKSLLKVNLLVRLRITQQSPSSSGYTEQLAS